jgi:hypothetical protein
MIKKLFFNILFTFSAVAFAFSQTGTITLENGKRIPYEKFKRRANSFQIYNVTDGKKLKVTIPTDSIKYYQEATTTYYKKPNILDESYKHTFIKREVVGKINVYYKKVEYYVSGQYGGHFVSNDYIYLEKGERYELLFIPNSIIKNKKEKIKILKSFIEDDNEILAKVESDDFKVRAEDVIQIIKEYNRR